MQNFDNDWSCPQILVKLHRNMTSQWQILRRLVEWRKSLSSTIPHSSTGNFHHRNPLVMWRRRILFILKVCSIVVLIKPSLVIEKWSVIQRISFLNFLSSVQNKLKPLFSVWRNSPGDHGCLLIFDNEDRGFDQSLFRAVGGEVNLGSVHLLANDSLLTAQFNLKINLDFHKELAQSKEDLIKFVQDFCWATTTVLSCHINDLRVLSIHGMEKDEAKSEVKFGLTTPNVRRNGSARSKATDSMWRSIDRSIEFSSSCHSWRLFVSVDISIEIFEITMQWSRTEIWSRLSSISDDRRVTWRISLSFFCRVVSIWSSCSRQIRGRSVMDGASERPSRMGSGLSWIDV